MWTWQKRTAYRKYVDPTEARIARDNADRKKERETQKLNSPKGFAKSAFHDAASKGNRGPMKTTAAGYLAAAKRPRKVL